MTNRTIVELYVGSTFQLSPPAFAVCLPQSFALANGFAGRNQLDVRDASDNFEVHGAAPLFQTRRTKASATLETSSYSRWYYRNSCIGSNCHSES